MSTGEHGDRLFDVALVGFGPVGATLANLLALDGLEVVALDREAAVYPLPRAVHFDDEVMRVFQTIAVAERILPYTHISQGMRFIDTEGRLFLDWVRPKQIGAQGWNVSYRFHQPDLERVLREAASERSNIDVRLRADVFALEELHDHVVVRYEDLTNGRLVKVRTRYVVGCDGARSLVRRFIDSEMEDLGFHERWLVVDALLKQPKPELGDHSIQFCDPQRPTTYVRGVGNRRRWEIAIMPGDDERTLTDPQNVWSLLSRWILPKDAELERAVTYTFHSTLARTWRKCRLVIAGDSAHQTPPFLGQGMCAGIRDAANLAWKLARVVRGDSTEDLLDTYQTERLPHVREYIELAVHLGGYINTKATPSSEATQAPIQMQSIRPKLGPGFYDSSCRFAGGLAPQPILVGGQRLDEKVGYRFAALMQPSLLQDLEPALLENCKRRGVTCVADDNPELIDWLGHSEAAGALVRPDRYVMGLAKTPDEMRALLAAL
jgi:3-(3-hydroxy-phenyl)propionate hydroxylase